MNPEEAEDEEQRKMRKEWTASEKKEHAAAIRKGQADWEKAHSHAQMQEDIELFERAKMMTEEAAIEGTARADRMELENGRHMQIIMLRDAFAAFDADGDGKLTEEEVVAALTRKTGQGTEFSEEAARATWKRWQADFDFDNDGTISIEELKMRREFIFDHRHELPQVGE